MAFKVAKDCDGVIADSLVPLCQEVNKRLRQKGLDFSYHPKDFTRANFLYEDIVGRTRDRQLAGDLDNLWYDSEVLRAALPCRGAVLVANVTRALGGDQYVITTRPAHLRNSTIDWFWEYLPFLATTSDRLRIRDPNDSRDGDQYKLDNLASLRALVYFEDRPSTMRYLLKPENKERLVHTRICLGTTGVNRNDSDLDSYRVFGWQGILLATIIAGTGHFRK